MRGVNFSLLLLLIGCSITKVNQPVKLTNIQKPKFESAVQGNILASRTYYLVWSNSNTYAVRAQIDSKINTNWNVYAIVINNRLSETNIQIYPTNSYELFKVGFR